MIGTGGRCRRLLRSLPTIPKVCITAMADVWDTALAETRRLVGNEPVAMRDYRALLDRRDVDAVIIATADHWHVPATIDAVMAGKDVYVEKPLTHTLAGGPRVIQAVRQTRQIVQVGMQQRSMPHLINAREIAKSGHLGKIHKIHMTWNRLTDLMVHWLDVAHWFLDLTYPESAATIGDHFAREWGWQTPDTVQTPLHYQAEGVQAFFEGTFLNARNAAMTEFIGDHATLYIDRRRYEVIAERGRGVVASEWILGAGPRGADFYENPNGELLHVEHWLVCIRMRREPNTPEEAGVSAAAGAHLGNIAWREAKLARWREVI